MGVLEGSVASGSVGKKEGYCTKELEVACVES